ncbi:alpha/beta hydrolase [Piscibacillus halophilus]|uniref:alpha/beta hydrolase n=1 Tax=Piscibacillus halophilus TaxID=571933 RepID=UPI00240A02E4|nr:alpha/beta hydrolase [Piscibacillus halophilus]
MLKMWRKKFLKNGKQLFIHETPGEKGTIIGVHGLTGHHMQLGHYQKAFEKQFRMITYDLRGRGKSSEADPSTCIDQHVDDLVELIDLLKVERPILMGYSMGAYICLKAASRLENVGAVILLDGAAETDEGQKELILPSLVRLKTPYSTRLDYITQTRKAYEKLGIRWSEHMNRIVNYEIEKQGDHWEHKSDSKLIEKDFMSFFDYNVEQYAPSITAPVLLVQATGHMVGRRPLFYDFQFYKLEQLINTIETIKTKANHLTLVFNKQVELEWRMLDFLNRHFSLIDHESTNCQNR